MPCVKLTVTEGDLPHTQFVFDQRTRCLVGRAEDCDIRFPMDRAHQNVSRYHCAFDVDPPYLRVRDLGSRNGTYVNDQKIGQRLPQQTPDDAQQFGFAAHELHHGDEVRVGHTVFRVDIGASIDTNGLSRSECVA